jgi:4-hydroxybenzoate polyprenyltransferase
VKPRTFLELGRTSNLPTVWTNVAAGAVLGARDFAAAPLMLGLCAIGSSLYVGGMFLNDAFDAEIDARERPERPIPSGRATRRQVFTWGFGMLSLGVAALLGLRLAGVAGRGAAEAGLFTAVAIVAYDRWHKAHAWSPLVMGLCRAGLFASSGLAIGGSTEPLWIGALLLFAYVVGLTHVARFETGSVVERVWPSLLVLAPSVELALRVPELPSSALWLAVPVWALASGWVVYALSLALRGGMSRIRGAVGALIAGIAAIDGARLAFAHQGGLAFLALLAFGLTLWLQRRVRAT